MNADGSQDQTLTRDLRWPLRVTRAGIAAERITRAFWPVWTIAFAAIAALALGLQDRASVELFWVFCLLVPVGLF